MDDPERARLRRMVSGVFTIKRVEALRPAVQRIAEDFITRVPAGSTLGRQIQAGGLTRREAAAMGVLLLLGGHETTAT